MMPAPQATYRVTMFVLVIHRTGHDPGRHGGDLLGTVSTTQELNSHHMTRLALDDTDAAPQQSSMSKQVMDPKLTRYSRCC